MRYLIILLVLGVLAPNTSYCQNRIAVQAGMFHCFFDNSPIINKVPNKGKKTLRNLLGGILNDSKGVLYERRITNKSFISAEFMVLSAGYNYKVVYNNPTVQPVSYVRNIKNININYSRKLDLSNSVDFVYGGGINYLWGNEQIYHYTLLNGWGEPRFYGHYRHDFALNLRTGIEYSPLKWLTLYTNFDFLGVAYLGAKDTDGNNASDFYKEKFGRKDIPSRWDLSWRFGIGFNFGK